MGEGVKRWEEKDIETREYGARKEKENTTRRQHENIINKEKSTREWTNREELIMTLTSEGEADSDSSSRLKLIFCSVILLKDFFCAGLKKIIIK